MTVACSDASQARDEPLIATASRVSRWLLVEHPGSWGPPSPPTSRLSREVDQHLVDVAARAGARLLLVRRPVRLTTPGRWVFSITSTPGHEQVLQKHVDSDDELLRPLTDWQVRQERLWLVCTHGRHDICCSVRGRPVVTAMLAAEPDSVWEASHVGGDRFAATVVLLPEGHYFGRVTADAVPDLMTGARSGRLDIASWRGRSSLPLPSQAAQAFAARETGRDRMSDLALVEQHDDGPDRWRVRLAGDVEVVVRYVRQGDAARLTCGAERNQVAAHFVLERLRT